MWEQKKRECGAPCSIVLCLERQEMTIPEPIEGWPRSILIYFSSKSYAVYGRWRACSAAWSHSTTWQNTKSQPHASSLQNKSHEIYGIDWNIWLQISSSFFVLFCSSVLCDIMLSSMLIPSWSISRIVSCLSKTSRPWAILTKNFIFNGGESTLKCIDISCSVFSLSLSSSSLYSMVGIRRWQIPTIIITVKTPPWWDFDWWEYAGEPYLYILTVHCQLPGQSYYHQLIITVVVYYHE